MTINERFFDLLVKSGATQKHFSQSTGISEKTISNWKQRGNNPSTEHIPAICKFFNVTYSFFLTGEDEQDEKWEDSEINAAINESIDTLFKTVLENSQNLDENGKSLLFDILVILRSTTSPLSGDAKSIADKLFLLKSTMAVSTFFIESCKTKQDLNDERTAANIERKAEDFRDELFHYIDDMNK